MAVLTAPVAQLEVLARLLDVARAGTLFPDSRRVLEWVGLISRPWRGKSVPKVELHPVSGLPTRRSLQRLLERQRLARAFFEAHRARPKRASDEFNSALAAAELFRPGTEVKPVSLEKAALRVLVVHDAFDAKAGTLVRFSVQLEQRGPGTKHVRVSGGACAASGPFGLAVEQACDGDATACALRLDALEGLSVVEVVRGELGPLELRGGGEAVFSLTLERVGATVTVDAVADAWPPVDAFAAQRAAKGWKRSRERKLICTPGLEAMLRKGAAGSRMLVRCR